jgi:oxygen-dependent protoporphyrinogen oxidase
VPPAGITVVGETVAGSGLAGLIAHAERTASELLTR